MSRQWMLLIALSVCTRAAIAGASAHGEELNCAAWAALTSKERFVVIGSLLEQKIGRPGQSALAACLWTISDGIADHTSEICARRNVAYKEALGLAYSTAVDFCRMKTDPTPKSVQPTPQSGG